MMWMGSVPETLHGDMPALFAPRRVGVWLVLFLLVIYLIFSFFLFFETIAPVANFPLQPTIAADAETYWHASGVRAGANTQKAGPETDAAANLLGPVLQAVVLRTDFNVALSNCLLFGICIWLLAAMPEFNRVTFLLLMMANPFLIAALITLNKEIFALSGMIFFVRYTRAKRFRLAFLIPAIVFSLFARWQQVLVLLIYIALESRLSPFRNRRGWGVAATVLAFTIGYSVVYRLVPGYFSALLTQAAQGSSIVLLDRIQAVFGFPLVVLPKILMNCLGHWASPHYFIYQYFFEDFLNWRDQIFMQIHTLLLTTLLVGLFLARKLMLRNNPAYLLVLYLMMTAINPMIQPRYEYAAYVLLCLEASRRSRNAGLSEEAAYLPSQQLLPSAN